MEALGALGHFLLSVVVGLLILTVLVAAHEWGHYLFARWCGMRVNAFAIFMGGVRKTDLRPWLRVRLAPGWLLWGAFFAAVVVLVFGALAGVRPLYAGGIWIAGVVVPLWAVLRLGHLYHLGARQVLVTWLKAIAVAAVVLVVGTKLQGVSPEMLAGVASGATLISLMLVYYAPVQAREPEDDQQGFGEITVKDERVSVRFRPVWSRQGKDGTEFSLLLLPLGGFAAIRGMHAKPDGSEVRVQDGFYSRPPWQRLAVLFAGPLFSVLFGLLVLTGTYAFYGKQVPDNRPIVESVSPKMGAAKAGILPGDEVLSIDGSPVKSFYDITVLASDNWREGKDGKREGIPATVVFRREGRTLTAVVIPTVDEVPLPVRDAKLELSDEERIQARLGVTFGLKFEHVGLGGAFSAAVRAPIEMVKGLADTVGSLVTRPKRAADNVAGPTAMAEITSAAVEQGSYQIFILAGLLSISLGVMNLLPIVPLDGGQMLVAFVEMLRGGRRLSFGLQNVLANSGIALLVLMMLAVSAVDLGRRADANKSATEQGQR